MSFLALEGRTVVVFGLANKKSLACAIGRVLVEAGANLVLVVRSAARAATASSLFPGSQVFVCDVEQEENIARVAAAVREQVGGSIHGLVHSIAYANYSSGIQPFYKTAKHDFLQAVDISCFSLIAIAHHFKELLAPDGSVVTISISTTKMAAENYGYMAPIKAALESSLVFLAKSFAADSRVRFNAVCPSLLKTSASAGIPGYIDSYLYAEQVIPRKSALTTAEAADVAAFLLSPRASGINGQCLVVDAGMSCNYFDSALISKVVG